MGKVRNSSLLGQITVFFVIYCCCLPVQGKYGGGIGTESDPYIISDANHMQAIGADANDWDKCFKLMADIDLSGITYTTAVIAFDTDYSSPSSFDGVPFTGEFDGNGNRILNLTIDTEGLDKDYLGLFGLISEGAVVANLGLEDVNVSGSGNWINGDFTGGFGALVGDNSGVIKNCWISGFVKGGNFSEDVGGLCGWNQITGSITRCYVIGSVICGPNSGGIGGLCGSNDGGIANCWASSSVTGRNSLGGLCGFLDGGSITNSYSTGLVNGTAEDLGGLCGERDGGNISNCFWDVNTSGLEASAGGEGKTTAEMQEPNTFIDAGWDFVTPVWMICGQDYPKLIWNYPNINGDGRVDFFDFAELAAYWLNIDCGMCGGTDLTGDRDVDKWDLSVFTDHWLYEDGICDHVFYIEIETEWDYGRPGSPISYDFEVDVTTDDTVVGIEFITPAGNTYEIPAVAEQCSGEVCTFYEPDGEGRIEWNYYGRFSDPLTLGNYGNGFYTIIVHYSNKIEQQTTAWYGVPGTADPIPQPTIQPIMISPEHNSTVTSPVDFIWEQCVDANATRVQFYTENIDNGDEIGMSFPLSSTGCENVTMSTGEWDTGLSFENLFFTPDNGDGIPVECYKCSTTDYWLIVIGD